MLFIKKHSIFFLTLALLTFFVLPAQAATVLSWGEESAASYSELHDSIFLYGIPIEDYNIPGVDLKNLQMTNTGSDIDFIMNQYGDIAALGILNLGEENLATPTSLANLPSFGTTARLRAGNTYLLALHDGTYAKLRIDQILRTKITFTYVIQAEKPVQVIQIAGTKPNPSDSSLIKQTAYSNAVNLSFTFQNNAKGYDLYRSIAGAQYTKINELPLSSPSYQDKTTQAGLTYYYTMVSLDETNTPLEQSVPLQITVQEPAPTAQKQILLQVNNRAAYVDGASQTLDVPPTIVNGRTLVPLRFIVEALGAQLDWDAYEQKISLVLDNKNLALWVNRSEARLNNAPISMDVPPQIVSGRTMVPVRFISEKLNLQVQYDPVEQRILISNDKSSTNPGTPPQNSDLSTFFHTYKLRIPGVSYVNSDGYRVFYGDPSAVGALTVKADGTYTWLNNYGDVSGTWTATGESLQKGYPILLHKGKQGKEWQLGISPMGGDILLRHDYDWEIGDLVQ